MNLRESIVLDKELQGYIDKYDQMSLAENRQNTIDRIEGLTGIYADWSSLKEEELKKLLMALKPSK